MAAELHTGRPLDLEPGLLYRILQLRVDVFVVEQACAYPELDGRDLEPGTLWVWALEGGEVSGTLRLLREPDGTARIGRVATRQEARSSGLGARLMERALREVGEGLPVVLDAQSHLQVWYERFGFRRDGEDYVEDGIPHVPMRRALS
jgi:ElaA protein